MESGSDPEPSHPNLEKRDKIVHRLEGLPSSFCNPSTEFDPSLMPDFPNEIVIEILSRLPAKSLGKFKCVSQSWLSLISSPTFINTHLALASGRDGFGHHRLIFTMFTAERGVPPVLLRHEVHSVSSLQAFVETTATEFFEIDYPFQSSKAFWLVGSCNGLVCLQTRDHALFLCNPCTKKFKKLPAVGITWDFIGNKFGFGYDALNEDCKVMVVCGYAKEIHVYSLKTNSWRKMEHFKIGITEMENCLSAISHHVSGKLYWPVMDGSDNWKFASFDLENETCEFMDRPNHTEGKHAYGLGEMGGYLCVIYDKFTCADLWIMKDSWMKVVSIPCADVPRSSMTIQSVCALRNGELLCILYSALFLYNIKTNTSRRYPHIGTIGRAITDSHIGSIGRAIMYVESLVLP